jgi:hypothetical protein
LWVFAGNWYWQPPTGGWATKLGRRLHSPVIPAPSNPFYRYVSVISWRETLRSMALRYENGFTATVRMQIDPDTGRAKTDIQALHDPLARTIWSTEFDSRYVRQCAINSCRRLFWATRLTDVQLKDPRAELGHDQRHANTLSARRSRKEKQAAELRNSRWRANYRIKYKHQRAQSQCQVNSDSKIPSDITSKYRVGLSAMKIAQSTGISIEEVKRYVEILDRS